MISDESVIDAFNVRRLRIEGKPSIDVINNFSTLKLVTNSIHEVSYLEGTLHNLHNLLVYKLFE